MSLSKSFRRCECVPEIGRNSITFILEVFAWDWISDMIVYKANSSGQSNLSRSVTIYFRICQLTNHIEMLQKFILLESVITNFIFEKCVLKSRFDVHRKSYPKDHLLSWCQRRVLRTIECPLSIFRWLRIFLIFRSIEARAHPARQHSPILYSRAEALSASRAIWHDFS